VIIIDDSDEGAGSDGEIVIDVDDDDDDASAATVAEEPPADALSALLSGAWLDPPGAFWRPRRGARTEVSAFLGGEAGLGELGTLDRIPSIGGTTVSGMARYYPVDRLAIQIGSRGYLGVAEPAAGTTAQTVIAPFAGVRWDLVRENRFSLLTDIASGPAVFLFADLLGAFGAAWALGAEATAAVTFRYSLGPITGELRTFVGGRVGQAQQIGRPSFAVGPFSALYAGSDLGVTWSFGDDGDEREAGDG
jgi:hypothetical protein